MAIKATQTHFRGIRLSFEEIAISKRPIGCTDSVKRLETTCCCHTAVIGDTPDRRKGPADYRSYQEFKRLAQRESWIESPIGWPDRDRNGLYEWEVRIGGAVVCRAAA